MSNDLRDTKLYELLVLLSPQQQQQALDIHLIRWKKRSKDRELLAYLIQDLKRRKMPALDQDKVMESLNIGGKATLHKMTSRLFQYLRRVLYVLGVKEPPKLGLDWVYFFEENNSPNNKKGALEDFRTNIQKQAKGSNLYHFYESQYNEHLVIEETQKIRHLSPYLPAVYRHLNAYHAENTLRLMCETCNRNRIIQQKQADTTSLSFDDFLHRVKDQDYYGSVSVELYYHLYQMLTTADNQHYESTRHTVYRYLADGQPDSSTFETIVAYLMNQCINNINRSIHRLKYAQEYLGYISLLEQEKCLLSNEDQLSLFRFFCILMSAILCGRAQWMQEDFMPFYKDKLIGKHRTFVVDLAAAYLCQHNEQPKEAMNRLLEIDTKSLPRDLDRLLAVSYYKIAIEIYYAHDRIGKMEQVAERMRKYLGLPTNNEGIAVGKTNALGRFLYYVKRLNPANKAEAARVRKAFLAEQHPIAHAFWLEKVL